MRLPSSDALVVGISVLFTGVVMQWAVPLPVPLAASASAPVGEVEAGPLMMGTSLPVELLDQEEAPSLRGYPSFLDLAHGFYEEDREAEEETAFFHLGGSYGGLGGYRAEGGFGSPYALPDALAVPDYEGGEAGIEAFGVASPSSSGGARIGWSPLRAPRAPLPEPTSSLSSWLTLFSPTSRDGQTNDPFFERPGRGETGPLRITLPPVFLGALTASMGRPLFGGIDYSDPTGVGLPLLRVFGYETAPLSPHFRVGDFATRDGAPLARISPRLVQGLERLRESAGPFYVISGYRHPTYNASVGGRRISRHMAGQAADLYSPTRSSIDLARAAVASFGCGIGLGLGQNTIHVDVRGYLSTWTYPGAPLSETAFDLWILMLCDRAEAEDLGNMLQVEWTLSDSLSDVDLLNRLRWLTDGAVPADSVTRENAEAFLQQRRLLLAAYARGEFRDQGPGAVLVDISEGLPAEGMPLSRSYLLAGTPEAERVGVTPLVEWVTAQRHQHAYFVYAVRFPDGHTDVGIMTMGATGAPPTPSAQRQAMPETSDEPSRQNPSPTAASGRPASSSSGWGIVVNSTPDAVEAERDATRYRQALRGTGHEVSIRLYQENGLLYRIVIGPYPDAVTARRILDTTLSGHAPGDAWLLPPGN